MRRRAAAAGADEGARLAVDDQLEQRAGAAVSDDDRDRLVGVVRQLGLDAQAHELGREPKIVQREQE
jgi:hypothetical protein